MMHQLNMCCGTTCDKEVNVEYVRELKLALVKLEGELDSARVEARFFKDLYYESIGDIQKHFISVGKERS